MNTKPNNSLQITWEFPHPPTNVWRAWTDPSIAKLWFGSDPNGNVPEAIIDFQVNGSFAITFVNSDETEFTCQGIYKEIEPFTRLVFTWGWENPQTSTELITLQFTPNEHGTKMIFTQTNIDMNTLHNYEEGWRSTFHKLEKALENHFN